MTDIAIIAGGVGARTSCLSLAGIVCRELKKKKKKKKKKKTASFGQPTSLIARGRASATLPNVIHLCLTKIQRPPDRDAL